MIFGDINKGHPNNKDQESSHVYCWFITNVRRNYVKPDDLLFRKLIVLT